MEYVLQLVLGILGGGSGGWALTEVVKLAPFIPINEGMTNKLRVTAAFMSSLSVVLIGLADHSLDLGSVQGFVTACLQFGAAWGLSHLMHKMNKAPTPPAV